MRNILIAAVLMSCNGCFVAWLGAAGIVELSRPAIGKPAPPQPPPGEPVSGSDGSYGWRDASDPTNGFANATRSLQSASCTIDRVTQAEVHATCSGIPVLVRHDALAVYRLCPTEVDHAECLTVWTH